MSIFGNLISGLSGGQKRKVVKSIKTLEIRDFTTSTTAVAGQFSTIAYMKMPAGTSMCWGARDSNGLPAGMPAQITLKNSAGVTLTGTYSLEIAGPNMKGGAEICGDTAARFGASDYKRDEAILIDEKSSNIVNQDEYLVLKYMPPSTSNETLDFAYTGSKISLPATQWYASL